MCGRYAFTLPPKAMADLFALSSAPDYPPRYNITPTQPVLAIAEREGRRAADLFRWGFVPHWVKDPRAFPLLINARAETIAEKASFRDATRNSRCVVPASGYFEWMKGPDGQRRPYYITSTESETMAFAGLHSSWAGPNGEEVDTVCICTVDPNLDISGGYDRMPAILRGLDAVNAWLNCRDVMGHEAIQLLAPPPNGTMRYHPVTRDIGKTSAEGAYLIAPVAADAAPPRPVRRKAAPPPPDGQMDLF